MEKVIAGKTVEINEEGYLTDFAQWSKEVALEIAKDEEVEMTEDHWAVIDYLQNMQQKGEMLSIRGIKKSGVVGIKEFYKLFPKGPLKVSTKIAGIPKPKSCI